MAFNEDSISRNIGKDAYALFLQQQQEGLLKGIDAGKLVQTTAGALSGTGSRVPMTFGSLQEGLASTQPTPTASTTEPSQVTKTPEQIAQDTRKLPTVPELPSIPDITAPDIFKSTVKTGADVGSDFRLFKGGTFGGKEGLTADRLRIGGGADTTGTRDIKKKKQLNTLGLNINAPSIGLGI